MESFTVQTFHIKEDDHLFHKFLCEGISVKYYVVAVVVKSTLNIIAFIVYLLA